MDKSFLKICLLFLGVILLFHGQSLNNGFKVDDFTHISTKIYETVPSPLDYFLTGNGQHYNPLDRILNSFLFDVFSFNPLFFRIFNLLLLSANVLLLYVTLKYLFKCEKTSLLASLIFIMHPFTAEIVSQITFNSILLNALLIQSSFLFLVGVFKKFKLISKVLSLFLFFCSMLVWEGSILFPLIVFSFYFCIEKYNIKKTGIKTAPYLMISAVYYFIWKYFTSSVFLFEDTIKNLDLNIGSYLLGILQLLFWYFKNLFFADSIVFVYNIHPDKFVLNIFETLLLILAVLLSGFIIIKKFKSTASFYLLWSFIGIGLIFPASLAHSYTGMVIEPNWVFLSSIGFYAVIANFLVVFPKNTDTQLKKIVIFTLFIYLFIFSQWQHVIAKTDDSYSRNWVKVCPTNILANQLRADAFRRLGENEKAVTQYKKVIEDLEKLPVTSTILGSVYYRYATSLMQVSDDKLEAQKNLNKAIAINPECVHCYDYLASMELADNNFLNVEKHLYRGLMHGNFPLLRKSLAELYLQERIYFWAYLQLHLITQETNNKQMLKFAEENMKYLESIADKN